MHACIEGGREGWRAGERGREGREKFSSSRSVVQHMVIILTFIRSYATHTLRRHNVDIILCIYIVERSGVVIVTLNTQSK